MARMKREELSEVVAGLLMEGKLAVASVDARDLVEPYAQLPKLFRKGIPTTEDLIAALGPMPYQAALQAARSIKDLPANWPTLLQQASVRHETGMTMDKMARKLIMGDEVDLTPLHAAIARMDKSQRQLMPLSKVAPDEEPFVDTGYAPIDNHIGGVPKAGLTVIAGPPGCLSADTVVEINRAGKSFKIRLDDLYFRFHGGTPRNGKPWSKHIPTMIRSYQSDGTIRLSLLEDVLDSGGKLTYEVTLESGRKIRATAKHPFLTHAGWKKAAELCLNDEVIVDGGVTHGERQSKKTYPSIEGLRFHPNAGRVDSGRYAVVTHRLSAEAELNGLSLNEFVRRCRTGEVSGLEFLSVESIVHHVNRDVKDYTPHNLRVIENQSKHAALHGQESAWKHVTASGKFDRVVSVRRHRIEPTYDLTVKDTHNFLANGAVVSNTGKTWMLMKLAAAFAKRRLKAAIFSLEMTAQQFAKRCATAELSKTQINYIDICDDLLSVSELSTIVSRADKVDFIGVDFAELMLDGDSMQTEQTMANIYRTLAGVAKRLGIPVVFLSPFHYPP